MQATLLYSAPVCSVPAPIHYDSGCNPLRYQQQRQAVALRLRRRWVRRRSLFRQRLNQVLSPTFQDQLNIRVVLDTRYLQRPDFIGVFEASGHQWMLGFKAGAFGGRWYFRSTRGHKLYSCSFRHLEAQLCYALGNCCAPCLPLV